MNTETIHTEVIENAPVNNMPEMAPTSNVMAMAGADPSAVAAAEVARTQIQMAFFMAIQNPRNQRQSWERIMKACGRPTFAKIAVYNKPVGNSSIIGPSIRMAEEIIRQWGNIMTRIQVVFEDETSRRVAVQVIDLETNNQYIKEIVTEKTVERKRAGQDRDVLSERLNSYGEKVYIVRATEEEMHNKEASNISKAIRNEGLRLIPSDVVDDAMKTALKVIADKDAKDPDEQLKSITALFSELRIQPRDVEGYLGHNLDQVTPGELQDLRGIYIAIRDQETTWAQVVEQRRATDPSMKAQDGTDDKTDALRKKLEDEAKKKAQGQGEPLSEQGAGEDEETPDPPQETADPAPEAQDDDFDLMEFDALIAWLEEHKRPGNGQDTKMVKSAAKSGNKGTVIALCKTFAKR